MGKSDIKENNKIKDSIETCTENSVDMKLSDEEMDSIDNSGQSRVMMIASLVKKLRVGIGADLTGIEFPSSFISTNSTHDYHSDNFSNHFNLLLKANKMDNELDRLLEVFKYSTSVHVPIEDCSKCPLQSVKGETRSSNFHVVDLSDGEGKLITDNYYIVEQLDDSPPYTASCIYNKREGVKVHFNNKARIIFHGTHLKTPLNGQSLVRFEKYDEQYTLEYPTLHSRFLRGFVEYCGEGSIKGKNSKCYITTYYNAKPLLGGSLNSYEAKIYNGIDSKPVYKIVGNWDGDSKITNCNTGETKQFYKRSTEIAKKIPEILPTDSSIVWKNIFEPISQNKQVNLAREKAKIIEFQKKQNWDPSHFFLNPENGLIEPKVYKD